MAESSALLAKLAVASQAARRDIEDLRDRRLQLLEAAQAVRAAPLPPAEIKDSVNHMLASAEDEVRGWISFGTLASAGPATLDVGPAMRNAPLGVLCLLTGREAIAAKLVTEAMRSKPGRPIPFAVREGELARIAGEIEDAGVVEERLIRAAEEAGIPIARRTDADPRHTLAEDI